MMPSIMSGSLIRETPPWARMSAGTRSSAITATAPASSAILACSAVTTSMITPPLSISAMPRFTPSVPVPVGAGLGDAGGRHCLACLRLPGGRGRPHPKSRGCAPAYVPPGRAQPAAAVSPAREPVRGYVVQVDGVQLGGPPREPQPAHPAPRRAAPARRRPRRCGTGGPARPGRSRGRARRPAARRRVRRAARARRPRRRTPPAAPGTASTRPTRTPRPGVAGRWRRRAAPAGWAGRAPPRRPARGVAPERRSSWASSVPRATSMRWCIRSSRFAVQRQPQADRRRSDQRPGSTQPPARDHRTPPATTVS